MKRIQTMADVQALKRNEQLPFYYIRAIEHEFLHWYEFESDGEPLETFCLPNHACIYHLDKEEDLPMIMDHIIDVEYVEVEKVGEQTFFRIGLMQDHQMSILYFLEGTFPKRVEMWLTK